MSIRWMTKVWDEATDLDGTELLVLLSIADHAQDDTACAWPSIGRLMQRARRSERTVQEALAALEEAGWIEREMRPGRSTMYHLRHPSESTAPPQPTAPPQISHPAAHRTPPPQPTAPITISEPPSTTPPVAAEVPVQEPSSNDGVSRGRDSLPVVLRRKLQDMGVTNGAAWEQAWQSAMTLEWPDFAAAEQQRFPEEHLMLHLMAQDEQGREPSATRWMRFYIEDRQRRITIIAGQIESEARARETPQEREDRLNKALPPLWEPEAPTGESKS